MPKRNTPHNSYDLMKHEWKMNAAEAVYLRGYEVKYRNKAQYLVSKEYLDAAERWAERRETTYIDRMNLRRNQRYLTLARAFHKGTPYERVETPNFSNEGRMGERAVADGDTPTSTVNTHRLQSELQYWDVEVTIEVLNEWVA